MTVGIHHDVVAFVRRLREAGIRVGIDQSESFARALSLIDMVSRRELYLAARATLVTRQQELVVFEEVFDAWFGSGSKAAGEPRKAPRAPRHDRNDYFRTALISYMAQRASPSDAEVELPEQTKAASGLELLQRKDFSDCTPDELAELSRALREVRFDLVVRRSHRMTTARHGGRLDMRRALRDAARHAGAVVTLPRRTRKLKLRPLVVLADISGSMELYSRIMLQFLHGITQRHRQTETFVFGTRLTRITTQLQLRDVDTALGHATSEIADFAGGTRIGECLRDFNRLYARRVLRRGVVVLMISDGWETGDVAELDHEMALLKQRSYRLVWLNPLLGRADYEPRVHAMGVALGYVDDFLPIHDLQSLQQLSAHVSRVPRRKGSVGSRSLVVGAAR